jgi:hypothetical protein
MTSGKGSPLSRVNLFPTNTCSQVLRIGNAPEASYFFATTIVLIVAVTFSTTSTTTM